MARFHVVRRLLGLTAAAVMLVSVVPVAGRAQLRPVAPLDWQLLNGRQSFSAGVGLGYLTRQQASLAGTRGDLLEVGNFQLGFRSGRIGLDVSGTLVRRFSDNVVLRPPVNGSDPPNGQPRQDAGDVVASTMVRLDGGARRLQMALRFGTRLPTPSNEPGLDRDRTDFFATLGGRYRAGPLALSIEGGVAILGTRVDGLDQLDVLTYSAGIESLLGPLTATGMIVGQDDVHRRTTRGNEDLSEVRLGLRAGTRHWFSATAVFGLTDYSPARGVLLMAGIRR